MNTKEKIKKETEEKGYLDTIRKLMSSDIKNLSRELITKYQTNNISSIEEQILIKGEEYIQPDYKLIKEKLKEIIELCNFKNTPLTLFAYFGDNENGILSHPLIKG